MTIETNWKKGLRVTVNPERDLVEIVEIPDHPWYVAVQFHPEFKSAECITSAFLQLHCGCPKV